MLRAPVLAAVLSLAGIGGARAQACLSYSDGAGGITISCPDGRTGYVHDDGNGAAGGMFAGQAFAGSSASLVPPFGPSQGVPSSAYITPPPPTTVPPAPPGLAQVPAPPLIGDSLAPLAN